MTLMQAHNRAFKAETQKLKHSGMFWLCFGAALFIPLLNTIISFFIDMAAGAPDVNRWSMFIESVFRGFTGFFFPLFLVLMMIRLVYLEHRSDTWKLLETQPIPKAALFIAKWEVAALMSLLCLLGVFVFALVGGLVLQVAKPAYNFSKHPIDWSGTVAVILRFWIASLAIISVQYFLGLIVKSFAWPMGIGLMAVIAGSIFAGFGVLTWFPYSATALTSASYKGSAAGNFLLHHEKLSLLWSALLLWMGYQYFVRKSFSKAFFSPLGKSLAFGAAVVLFCSLTWFISKPSTLSAYNKTVIAGTIKSKKTVNNVVLLQAPAFDTIMTMPVTGGKFHGATTTLLEPGIYYVQAGSYRREVFFGSNDSLFLDLSVNEMGTEEKLTGTRIAENEYMSKNRIDYPSQLTDYAYNLKPAAYSIAVRESWEDGIKKIDKFKTIDNLKPRADFIAAQKKLLAFKLVNLLDNYYPQVHAVYYPNDSLKYPKSVERLRKEANGNDSSLAMYADFRSYLTAQLRSKSGRNDSLFYASLAALPGGKIKDYVLFDVVQNEVFRMRDSFKRDLYFRQVTNAVSNVSLQNSLLQKQARLQSLGRGRKAPPFSAEAINATDFDLTKLANRYVVLDVWATWCAPCKKEAPYFEELADKYTSEQLAFVSVSIDENKNAWRMEAAGNRAKVLQLWAKNANEDFSKSFAVSSIPRYMLIDPKGNIVNADLPPPSDPQFEAILQREISFLSNRSL